MTGFRWISALLYSAVGVFFVWFGSCAVFLLLWLAGWDSIGTLPRMFLYHIKFFYLYFAVIALVYGGFLLLWFRFHPKTKWKFVLMLTLGGFLIVSVSSYPCTLLYILHDMQAGFYPKNLWGAFFGQTRDFLLVGWYIVLLSFPLNLLAVFAFFFLTRKLTRIYDSENEPAWADRWMRRRQR